MADDIQELIKALSAVDAAARRVAAERLGTLGEKAQTAAAALVKCVSDTDESVREAVTSTLEELGPPAKEQLGELTSLVKANSADVAYWAATLVGRLKEAGSAATDSLARCLNETQEMAVRERAAWALGEIGPQAKSAVEALKKAAADGGPRLARLAKQALEQITG
jgi:HEAT repeat protein